MRWRPASSRPISTRPAGSNGCCLRYPSGVPARQRKSPRRSSSCCRTRRAIPAALSFASPAGVDRHVPAKWTPVRRQGHAPTSIDACAGSISFYDPRADGENRPLNSIRYTSKREEIVMVAGVRVHKHGGPEVLTYEQFDLPAPGQGQVRLKHHASGVNFIDTYFRSGLYPSPVGMPFVSGNEGAGEVTAVGPGVTDLKVGDRVGYVVALGGYAEERNMPADRAVKLPDNISYEQAAAMIDRKSV